jgi:hypothetical protein
MRRGNTGIPHHGHTGRVATLGGGRGLINVETAPHREARLDRRALLRAAGALGLTAGAAAVLDGAPPLRRAAHAAPAGLPQMQYAIEPFLAPPERITEPGAPAGGTLFRFGPTYTAFVTATLTRMPTLADRAVLERALQTIETHFPFRPDGVFTYISYGKPYFRRLPVTIVQSHLPRLRADTRRSAFEEAVPAPTDLHPGNPSVRKPRFRLITLRSDNLDNLRSIRGWLGGIGLLSGRRVPPPDFAGLFQWTSTRLMFAGRGLPRRIADGDHLPFAEFVHPQSPMWMGFADQATGASGPPAAVSFQGSPAARLTTENGQGYFADSTVQVLTHVILDLHEWYLTNDTENEPRNPDVAFLERVQYMYRTNDPPAFGFDEQFTDGGGPTFLPNHFRGANDALESCHFGSWQQGPTAAEPVHDGSHRVIGHTTCLQRSSRAPDGTPLHIRMDGPGYDTMDVPDGSSQPKLHFSAVVPTAEFFRQMRVNQASLDLVEQFDVEPGDRGLDPRLTTTRRQNFLMPGRSHRAFPLLEFQARPRPARPVDPIRFAPPKPATGGPTARRAS